MSKSRILIQLDPDKHASAFDAVVAVDAGVDHLFQYDGVEPSDVQDIVYGAMFTRGPADLCNTAVFVGGKNVAAGEVLLKTTTDCFFGPMRVSVMLDANGANTTASAAVVAASRHVALTESRALVLGGTGPVGQRVARLLASERCQVRVASRSRDRAAHVCEGVARRISEAQLTPVEITDDNDLASTLADVDLVVSAGAAGVQLVSATALQNSQVKVAIDLNAVPPLGIEGIGVADKAADSGRMVCYGAIGVGGTKMAIHKAALRRLFETNDVVLDAEEIYAIGRDLEG